MKKFRPPLDVRIMFGMAFWILWLPALLTVLFVIATRLFTGFQFGDVFIVCSISFTFLPLISLVFIFPTIGVSEECLTLYAPWGEYKKIQWRDIVEISRALPPRGVRFMLKGLIPGWALFVKAEGLGWIFYLYGFMYSNGGSGFIIHPKINNSKELASLFKKYAPHAFPELNESQD